jgi:hypothetical protein
MDTMKHANKQLTSLVLLAKITFSSLLFSASLTAEPWINTSDLYLKANIQQLASTGYITTPITTYPLMWNDIVRDLKKIDTTLLTKEQYSSYAYIKHQYKLAKKNQTTLKVNVAAKDSRFTSFGDTFREKNSVQISSSFVSNHFAAKVSPMYTSSTSYGDKKRFDDSYIAALWGNWAVSLGKQNRWFGPTWDSSFSLTNNARPMPALALSRKSALPFTIPFTDIDVPWTLTTFMGKMDDERIVNNTLLWGFRVNFKPIKNLEIGLSRLAQWGGDNRSKSLTTFWDVLIGRTNCGIDDLVCNENHPNPANQQAGYDFRYTTAWFTTPITLYGQKFAEDGNDKAFRFVTKAQLQLGIDATVNLFSVPSTLYFEYGDSLADCGKNRDGLGDCYYEHSSYQTGMRYHGRTISNLYDNDTKSYVLGVISQLDTNTHLSGKLRYLKLNYDNQDKSPNNPLIGNPLTSIAENVYMLSTSFRHSYKNWRVTLAFDISHSSFVNDIADKNHINSALTVEYNL